MSTHGDTGLDLGVRGLSDVLGRVYPPYTVLIAGHPGSGKTTLAATICYNGAVQGKKCLYITFYEDKEKLYSYMEKVGVRLSDVEAKGTFSFLKLPVTLDIDSLIDVLNKSLSGGFDVVVVDSITVILEAVKDTAEKRSWLLNYFYQLPKVYNGLLVLISELPYGEERLELGPLEFVADAVIVLKQKIEDRYLVRLLEVRKTRGNPIHVAEVPFTIRDGLGLLVYAPPKIEEIPQQAPELELVGKVLRNKIGHLHEDFLVNIHYPPETVYGKEALLAVLAHAVKYGLKVLVISYVTSPSALREALRRLLVALGISPETVEELIDKHFVFKALNPFAYSLEELAMKEISIIEEVRPNVVVFHGTHVPGISFDPATYFKELYKQVLYLKQRRVLTVRIGNCVDELKCNMESSISDLTLRVTRRYEENKAQTTILVYRRFREPTIITEEERTEILRELVEFLLSRVSVKPSTGE